MSRGQLGDDGARLRLGQRSQPPIDFVECRVLLGRRSEAEVARFAIHAQRDLRRRPHHLLEGEPPEVAASVGKVARHIDGKRRIVAAKNGIGVVAIVAIAVIQREAGERLLAVGVFQALAHLIERNDVEARVDDLAHDVLEEIGRHLEDAIGLERLRRRRVDMMQHENDAGAARVGGKQIAGTGIVDGGQCCLEERRRSPAHAVLPWRAAPRTRAVYPTVEQYSCTRMG